MAASPFASTLTSGASIEVCTTCTLASTTTGGGGGGGGGTGSGSESSLRKQPVSESDSTAGKAKIFIPFIVVTLQLLVAEWLRQRFSRRSGKNSGINRIILCKKSTDLQQHR